jgi:hypothetical protein
MECARRLIALVAETGIREHFDLVAAKNLPRRYHHHDILTLCDIVVIRLC